MFLNILKKDLKRKKTMNVILLFFTILAAMFVSSGLSNVVTVMKGTDYFLDKANVGDYIVITQSSDGGVEKIIQETEGVKSYTVGHCFWGDKTDISFKGQSLIMNSNTILIQTVEDKEINYFLKDQSKLEKVEKGQVYVTAGTLKANEFKVGDVIDIDYHGIKKSFEIKGEFKDALLGSDMMGNKRFIISQEDYQDYLDREDLKPYRGCIFTVKTDNVEELAVRVNDGESILFARDRAIIKLSYVMEMIVAMIVLVLSICLVIVSFVLLKFVITFSIKEEFREIGVMKAIGIHNHKIRRMYIVKYVGISVAGGLIGFILGIPFGRLLLGSVSTKMILGNDAGLLLNLVGTLLVIFIMILFAYLCTSMVKKSTPVDAIRSGQTGERYKKKASISLRKCKTGNAFFMALNDVLSAPRRFITIIISFVLCSLFVFGVVMVSDTMKSDRLIETFGKRDDVYITDGKLVALDYMSENGEELIDNRIAEIESDLKKLDMPGKVTIEIWYKYNVTSNGKTFSETFQQNKRTRTEDYKYTKGSAPINAYEVAITPSVSKEIDAVIGDTITIDFGDEKRDCIVTGYFQSMNQLGSIIRLHQDAPTQMVAANTIMNFQVDFEDDPSDQIISERIEKIKDYYNINDVFDATGFCDNCMRTADTMDLVAKLLLFIVCIVVILVTVLMERSFISNETTQIALLKAMGFKNSFILSWQVYRFMIIAIASELLAIILTYPVTRLWCDPIWGMMGATDVDYFFKPLSLLVIYPGIIIMINLITVFITALYTNKITSRDVMNIE